MSELLDADLVFEPFGLPPSDDGGRSSGIAQCERIVERHGGDICVDSEPGEGTTSYLSVPAAGESDA